MEIPTDVLNIITDYAYSMEHYEKMRHVFDELHNFFQMARFSRVRLEFQSIFFPDWNIEIL